MTVRWGALALLTGIALGYAGATGGLPLQPGVALAAVTGGCIVVGWRLGRTGTALVASVILAAGIVRGMAAVPTLTSGDVAFYAGQSATVTGTVDAEPDVRDRTTFLVVAVQELDFANGSMRLVHGVVQVRYSGRPEVEYGEVLQMQGRLQGLATEEDASYRAYLRSQGIGAVLVYPRMLPQATGAGNGVKGAILHAREALQAAIGRMMPEPEASLLSALLVGGRGSSLGNVAPCFRGGGHDPRGGDVGTEGSPDRGTGLSDCPGAVGYPLGLPAHVGGHRGIRGAHWRHARGRARRHHVGHGDDGATARTHGTCVDQPGPDGSRDGTADALPRGGRRVPKALDSVVIKWRPPVPAGAWLSWPPSRGATWPFAAPLTWVCTVARVARRARAGQHPGVAAHQAPM